MAKVLIADDEATMVQMVTELLRSDGHEVFPFTQANAALESIETVAPELIVTDLYFDKTRPQGLELLQKARSLNPPALAILMTAFPTVGTAVEAMKMGAYDYLQKPFSLDQLKHCVERALSYSEVVSENIYLRKQLKRKYHFSQLIGASAGMQQVFKMIERVADTDSTVLVLGESGTGKELVAKALHYNSSRQFATFVPVNCSALPENLLESELFGHKRGSFTGAVTDKKGLFQEADGGTIFLDEIGTMPAVLQSRLLRVLQEREVRRVGENIPICVNVRVIAATNETLEKLVEEGQFREDLYYRLNVIPITLPPLRDRLDDIPLLVAHFLRDRVHSRSGKPFQITRQTMEVLASHSWPGNVRELENIIERTCTLAESETLRPADLPPFLQRYFPTESSDTLFHIRDEVPDSTLSIVPPGSSQPPGGLPSDGTIRRGLGNTPVGPLKNYLREQEVSYMNRVLAHTEGDKEQAANLLGISLATLYRKLSEEPDK